MNFIREEMFVMYALFFVGAIVFSYIVNSVFLKFASNLGIRNNTENLIRWSSEQKPSVGGISFFILYLLSIIVSQMLFSKENTMFDNTLLGIFSATVLAFVIGFADDAYNTKALLKFLGQSTCALFLIWTGTYIVFFENDWYNYMLTFFWVVAMMNSINLLDNMDGITAVTSIAALVNAVFVLSFFMDGVNSPVYLVLFLGVLAALIGFLPFNWNPAKMFMGDTGSQFLGLFLAIVGIVCFWNKPNANGELLQSQQLLKVGITFALPIIDTSTVFLNRMRKGQSPFVGGKDHTTHCLSFMGVSEKNVARVYLFIGLLAIYINYYSISSINWSNIEIGLGWLYLLLISLCLYLPTLKMKKIDID